MAEGALKVVFATETLAAGINMPARTAVISSLSRHRGPAGVVRLQHNELLQMAGRAGRRGYDTEGAGHVACLGQPAVITFRHDPNLVLQSTCSAHQCGIEYNAADACLLGLLCMAVNLINCCCKTTTCMGMHILK